METAAQASNMPSLAKVYPAICATAAALLIPRPSFIAHLSDPIRGLQLAKAIPLIFPIVHMLSQLLALSSISQALVDRNFTVRAISTSARYCLPRTPPRHLREFESHDRINTSTQWPLVEHGHSVIGPLVN